VRAARAAATAGHLALALAHLRENALARPDDPDATLALGLRLGEGERADDALRIAERLPGGSRGAAGTRLIGWYHVGAGEPARAAAFLLGGDGGRSDPERLAAALASARERGAEATAAAARAALPAAPHDALPRLLLGLAAGHRGDAAEACVQHAAALARDPALAPAANDLAWWLARSGEAAQRALPIALWAHHLAPDDPHVRHTASEARRVARRASERDERTPR